VFVLAAHPEPDLARDEDGEPRAGGEQGDDEGGGLHHVLEVVEHEQLARFAQERGDPVRERLMARLAHAQGLGEGRSDEGGIRNGRERDERHAVREGRRDLGGDREREPGLAHPAGAGERDQPDAVPPKQGSDRRGLLFAADEAGERHGKACRGMVPGGERGRDHQVDAAGVGGRWVGHGESQNGGEAHVHHAGRVPLRQRPTRTACQRVARGRRPPIFSACSSCRGGARSSRRLRACVNARILCVARFRIARCIPRFRFLRSLR
jgi:hypothetical protein